MGWWGVTKWWCCHSASAEMLVDDTAMEWMRLMEQSERSLIIGGEMPMSCPPSSSHLKPVYLSEQSH